MANHLEHGHECEVCKPEKPLNSPITGPVLGRRNFFKIAGTGVAGYFLTHPFQTEIVAQTPVTERVYSTARNCIFILLGHTPTLKSDDCPC